MALLGVLLTEKNMSWTTKVKDIMGAEYEFVDEYRTREMTLKDLLSHRTGMSGLETGVLEGFTSDVTREQLSNIHPVDPAGAILSNGEDMIKWMQFLLNKGRLSDSTVIVDEKLVDEAMKVVMPIPEQYTRTTYFTRPSWPIELTPIGYGHALFMSTYRGYKQIWHTGGFHSYHSIMILYPDEKSGVFASTTGPSFKSSGSLAMRTIPYFASDGVLNLEPWLNVSTTCTFPSPWLDDEETPPTTTYTTKNLAEPNIYSGLYEHGFLTSINISLVHNDSSKLSFVANVVSGILHATSIEDEFKMEILDPWEIMNSYTDNENRTVTTSVKFNREINKIVNMSIQYDVSITYVKTSIKATSSSKTIYSNICLLIVSLTIAVYY